ASTALLFGALFVVILTTGVTAIAMKFGAHDEKPSLPVADTGELPPLNPPTEVPTQAPTASALGVTPVVTASATMVKQPPPPPTPAMKGRPRTGPSVGTGGAARAPDPPKSDIPATRE